MPLVSDEFAFELLQNISCESEIMTQYLHVRVHH